MSTDILLRNARSFTIAAERCLVFKPLSKGTFELPLTPAMVNQTLSVELYLKYILSKQGKTIKTHSLHRLFNALDKNTLSIYNLNIKVFPFSTFDKEVLIHSDVFTKYRYEHDGVIDGRGIDIKFLKQICDCSELIIKKYYSKI